MDTQTLREGQVWTPPELASEMVAKLGPYLKPSSRIIDPCSGPGTFLDALRASHLPFGQFDCFEIDESLHAATERRQNFDDTSHHLADFLKHSFDDDRPYDAAILNPPYVRAERIDLVSKRALVSEYGTLASTNYFAYFLLKTARLLRPGGVMCAVIYDMLDHSRYGSVVLELLRNSGEFVENTSLESPFPGVLIDAKIVVWVKNAVVNPPLPIDKKRPSAAGAPPKPGYVAIGEIVKIQRGTSFKLRKDFVRLGAPSGLQNQPIITKQAKDSLVAKANAFAYLLSDDANLNDLTLSELLLSKGYDNERLQIKLPKPVQGRVIFNYYLRTRVRHILNLESLPASDNFYCLQFQDSDDAMRFWVVSNSQHVQRALIESSRPQGSGLRKLQLYEYSLVQVPDFRAFCEHFQGKLLEIAQRAAAEDWPLEDLSGAATTLLREIGFDD